LTLNLLHLGLFEQARRMAEHCLEEVIQSKNALTICSIVATTCTVTALTIGDETSLERYVKILQDYSQRFGLTHWLAMGQAFEAVIEIRRGNLPEGLRVLNVLLDETIDRGNIRYSPIFCEYAQSVAQAGNVASGQKLIQSCLERAEQSGQLLYAPEFRRINAAFLMMEDNVSRSAVETLLFQALDDARLQTSLLDEVRIATDLARLMHESGRDREARDLLAPVYERFSEGLQTRPLIEARGVLVQLG
jgi:predicted ATPase